jgi:hypothetical protein
MNHEYFNDLKKYIDDSLANFEKIKSDVNISAEEKTTLLYEIYMNFVDLEEESKDIRRDMRAQFKLRDAAVKKWDKENNQNEVSSEEKRGASE